MVKTCLRQASVISAIDTTQLRGGNVIERWCRLARLCSDDAALHDPGMQHHTHRVICTPAGSMNTSARHKLGCADQLTANKHPPDFVCASTDVEQLCIAIETLNRPIFGVACTTKRLNGLIRHTHCVLGGQ